jgi:hypothetical protein
LVNACMSDPRLSEEVAQHSKKLLENGKLPRK